MLKEKWKILYNKWKWKWKHYSIGKGPIIVIELELVVSDQNIKEKV